MFTINPNRRFETKYNSYILYNPDNNYQKPKNIFIYSTVITKEGCDLISAH